MEWERLPNGKFRPKKVHIKTNNKYDPEDPIYVKICKAKMKEKIIFCEYCKDFYNLFEPCIHHLPDSYDNNKKKYNMRKANKKINEEPVSNETKLFDFSQD